MGVRLAVMADLPQIQAVYTGIIEQMERDGLQIWDEIYPNEFFAADIEQQQLYVLERGGIAGAFALCAEDPGEEQVAWAERGGALPQPAGDWRPLPAAGVGASPARGGGAADAGKWSGVSAPVCGGQQPPSHPAL